MFGEVRCCFQNLFIDSLWKQLHISTVNNPGHVSQPPPDKLLLITFLLSLFLRLGLEVEWQAGDEEQHGVEGDEAGEEEVHGVPEPDSVPHPLNQDTQGA